MPSNHRPTSMKCPVCHRFMEFLWVSRDNTKALPEGFSASYDWIPAFTCRCIDFGDKVIPVDPEPYEWLRWGLTKQQLKKAQAELPEDFFQEILAEQQEMKRLYDDRPYLAIPEKY